MIKTVLTYDEIMSMAGNATCRRDRVIVLFYFDTGCRASELLGITVENCDLESNLIMIPHLKRGIKKHCPICSKIAGKSTKFCSRCGESLLQVQAEGVEDRKRVVNIGAELASELGEYILEENLQATDAIIKLSRQMIYNIIRTLAEKSGLSGKVILNPETGKRHYVHPHSFRDSFAVDWLDVAGDNISKQKALQEALGHQNFNTTMRYEKLTPAKVRQVGEEVRKARRK